MHDSAAFYPRPPLGDNIPMTIDELAVAERPMDISRSSSVINSMITPQAGEPSITFNLSGPIIVLRVNDLKGELPCGPLVINPDSVRASQFNLKIARQSSSVHLQVPAHPPLIIAGPFCQAEMTSTPRSIVSPLPIPILETLQRTPQPTPTEQHPPSPVLQAPRPHLTPA
jgi:hypothetical protein